LGAGLETPLGRDENAVVTTTGVLPTASEVIAERKEYGYSIYESLTLPNSRIPLPSNPNLAGLSPTRRAEFDHALQGDSTPHTVSLPGGGSYESYIGAGGCYGQALAQFYGSVTTFNNIAYVPQQLRSDIYQAFPSAPAVRDVTTKWSECMQAAIGLSFRTPSSLVEAVLNSYRHSTKASWSALRRREVAWATADAQCAYSTGLMAAYAASFRRSIEQLSQSEYGAIVGLQRAQKTAEAKATAYLEALRR
jgi:hypothetical protein